MKRKIIYVTGSRADYGLMQSVLLKIQDHPEMDLHIAATGMHLMPEFGNTIREIEQDNLTIHRLKVTFNDDTRESMARFTGQFIQKFVDLITAIRPDLILILGDRGEMLGAAVAGSYIGVPVVHLHGGEITATVDEIARHAITKLSHIHLPATQESADRIIRMGEDPAQVHVVGAPGLDQIMNMKLCAPDEINQRFHVNPSVPLLLILQHPVTLDNGDPAFQIRQTMEAVSELGEQAIVIYPNADAGGRAMIEEINRFKNFSGIRIFPNIAHRDFLSLLKAASVLVGNSSSGIIEAPSFGIPVVNIGSRQEGRQRGENVLETGYEKDAIKSAIRFALSDNQFKTRAKHAKNPYGDGKSSDRIVEILKNTRLSPGLLQKRMMY
jgi:GDP/UDP-N,N'-diacetylbacillosamine 2-epimerase (hydrolysing)